jgi:hypothetical protein
MNQQFPSTNQHDVEMMKVLVGVIPALLEALTAPVTHNHYHHQAKPDVGSNPYRSAKTVAELEQIVLLEPKTAQREEVLKQLAKFPESMPISKLPTESAKLLSGS